MIDDLVMLRAVERILAIVIGGLAIWCGFRLFLAVPGHPADAEAEFTLAENKRLLISRISPGIFFALFGAAVVVASLYFSTSLRTAAGDTYSGLGQRPSVPPAAHTGAQTAPIPDPTSMRLSLAFLSDIESGLANTGNAAEASWRAQRFRVIKLALIERGWESGWGDFTEFQLWLDEPLPRPQRPGFERALAVFEGRD